MQLTFMLTSINNVYIYRSRNEYLILLKGGISKKDFYSLDIDFRFSFADYFIREKVWKAGCPSAKLNFLNCERIFNFAH